MKYIPNTDNINVGYGYRLLAHDEKPKNNDEVWDDEFPNWRKVTGDFTDTVAELKEYFAEGYNFYYRRKIDVGEGYRLLGADEMGIGEEISYVAYHTKFYEWQIGLSNYDTTVKTRYNGDLEKDGVAYRVKVEQEKMKLRTEKVCIKVHSEKAGQKLWDLLVKVGYKPNAGFWFRDRGHATYIWVNPTNFSVNLASADNDDFTEWQYIFYTHNDWDKIIEFFSLEQNKNMNKSKQCVIKVGNSEELSKIVQEFLFSKGYVWTNLGRDFFNTFGWYGIWVHSDKRLYSNNHTGFVYPEFDAATEMGKIIEFFNASSKIEVNGTAKKCEIDIETGAVTYGCTTLPKDEVKKIVDTWCENIGK